MKRVCVHSLLATFPLTSPRTYYDHVIKNYSIAKTHSWSRVVTLDNYVYYNGGRIAKIIYGRIIDIKSFLNTACFILIAHMD